jgi:hypothetical protein
VRTRHKTQTPRVDDATALVRSEVSAIRRAAAAAAAAAATAVTATTDITSTATA